MVMVTVFFAILVYGGGGSAAGYVSRVVVAVSPVSVVVPSALLAVVPFWRPNSVEVLGGGPSPRRSRPRPRPRPSTMTVTVCCVLAVVPFSFAAVDSSRGFTWLVPPVARHISGPSGHRRPRQTALTSCSGCVFRLYSQIQFVRKLVLDSVLQVGYSNVVLERMVV